MRFAWRRFAVLSAGLSVVAANADAAVTLRYKWKKDALERYALTVENHTKITNPVAAVAPIVTAMTTNANMVQRVASVGAGVATLDTKFEDVSVVVDGPQAALVGDFKQLLERARFSMKTDDRGKIQSIVEATGLPPELKRFVQSLKQTLSQLQAVLPEGPIDPGATWTTSVDTPHALVTRDMLQTRIEATFVYVGPKEAQGPHDSGRLAKERAWLSDAGVAAVAAQGRRGDGLTVALVVTMSGSMRQAGTTYRVEIKGTGSGEMLFDNDVGAMLSSDVTVDLAGTWQGKALTVEQGSKVRTRVTRK